MRWRWTSVQGAAMAAVVVQLLLVQRSMQLRENHPFREEVDRINSRGGPYVGLLMAFPLEEAALLSSGLFLPSSSLPSSVQLAGRRFNIGTIRGVDVIYVMTGEQIINAGITTQILYDAFEVVGVVHYGIAGSTNNSLHIGDVSIPTHVAFTSSWDWQEYGSSSLEGTLTTLKFGAYNIPKTGNSLLGEAQLTPVQLFSSSDSKGPSPTTMKKLFWLPLDPVWFRIASQINDAAVLQRCINYNETTGTTDYYCLPEVPKAAFGLRGSTADVYLNNAAYRGFLWENLNISFVDEESAAIVLTSLSNRKPCLVFRGISDYAGGTAPNKASLSTSIASKLAATNAFNLAVEFIQLIGNFSTAEAAAAAAA